MQLMAALAAGTPELTAPTLADPHRNYDCIQGMRQELAQHLHRQVALISHQLDILICGKDSQSLAGQSCVGASAPCL